MQASQKTVMMAMINFWRSFWLGIWRTVKRMGSVKGVISLIVVWVALSGVGVGVVGVLFKVPYLIGLGGMMIVFWASPMTPLIPITIAIAMLFQRYVLADKSIGWKQIKLQFGEAFAPDLSARKRKWRYHDIALRSVKINGKKGN